jgi:hypothetical protein
MPRRDQLTRTATLDALEAKANTPDFVLCRFHELAHDRSSSSGCCPCCGSDTAKVVEDLPDFELLIDTVRGERYLRGPMFPEP